MRVHRGRNPRDRTQAATIFPFDWTVANRSEMLKEEFQDFRVLGAFVSTIGPHMPLLGRSSLNALSSLPARPNSATKESVFNHDSAASEAARNLSSSGTMFGYPHQNRAAAAGKREKVFPLCRPGLRPGSAAYPKFDSTLRRDL